MTFVFLSLILCAGLLIAGLTNALSSFGATDRVGTIISLNSQVKDIEVNSISNKVYLLTTESLIVLDGSTDELIANITLGFSADRLLVNDVTNKIYATHKVRIDRPGYAADHHISVVDGNMDVIEESVKIEGNSSTFPYLLAVDKNANEIFFAKGFPFPIYLLDGESNEISSSTVAERPSLMEIDQISDTIFLAGLDENGQIVLTRLNGSSHAAIGDELTLIDSSRGSYPTVIMFDPVNRVIYLGVLENDAGFLYLIDTYSPQSLEVVNKISMQSPDSIAIAADRNLVFVSDSRRLVTIDGVTHEVVENMAEDSRRPSSIAYNPNSGKLYVSDFAIPNVYIMDQNDARFTLSSELDGKEYDIEVVSENLTVNSLTINPGKSLVISIIPSANSSMLTLGLPKELIEGIVAINASSSASSDSTKSLLFEESSNSTATELTFSVPPGTSKLEIIGAKIVPEFGQLQVVVLVAAVMISSIIIINGSRRIF